MVIVGTGVLAMVSAQQAYHIKNDWAQRTGTAQMLANEVREMMLSLPQNDPISCDATLGEEANENVLGDWDDLADFPAKLSVAGFGNGTTFNPPVNGLRLEIDGLDKWSQVVTVENVLPDNISTTASQPLGSTNMMRVRVEVRYQRTAADDVETFPVLTWVVN